MANKSVRPALLIASLAILPGCTKYRDVYPIESGATFSAYPDSRKLRIFEDDSSGGSWVDIAKGSGADAYLTRRLVMDIAVTDPHGKPYGSGRVTILFPGLQEFPSGKIDHALMSGVIGMKVGGMRRITLPGIGCYYQVIPGHSQQQVDTCEISGVNAGEASFTYPGLEPIVATVSLRSVCRPQLVEKSTYRIPDGLAERKIVERGCR
jgi:hypothetical protein